MINIGAAAFGLVIGWVTYRTLRRSSDAVGLSDIATVIGAVGGAAVTTLFDEGEVFAFYAVGLAVGFFAYFVIGLILGDSARANDWMLDR
jgi:O-antigen/teichoic acid export membrane protein